ncbi:hypothetical protein AALO_G00057570, partial [Alosa alosa]
EVFGKRFGAYGTLHFSPLALGNTVELIGGGEAVTSCRLPAVAHQLGLTAELQLAHVTREQQDAHVREGVSDAGAMLWEGRSTHAALACLCQVRLGVGPDGRGVCWECQPTGFTCCRRCHACLSGWIIRAAAAIPTAVLDKHQIFFILVLLFLLQVALLFVAQLDDFLGKPSPLLSPLWLLPGLQPPSLLSLLLFKDGGHHSILHWPHLQAVQRLCTGGGRSTGLVAQLGRGIWEGAGL